MHTSLMHILDVSIFKSIILLISQTIGFYRFSPFLKMYFET